MTDPHPLLSHSGVPPVPESQPPLPKLQWRTSLDDTIEHYIGELGWKHLFLAIFVSFAWFFDAQQTFVSVFTDAEPKWSCLYANQTCNRDVCRVPAGAWTWDSPPEISIISQCAAPIIKGLPISAFFFGCLVGGFALATLADSSLGRKNMLVLSTLLMSVTGLLTALSTGFLMYNTLRFVSGFGRATVGTCALVLSTEMVGKKWRENIGIAGFICSALGFLSLPAIAYFTSDSSWRYIYVWICVPPIIYSFLIGSVSSTAREVSSVLEPEVLEFSSS